MAVTQIRGPSAPPRAWWKYAVRTARLLPIASILALAPAVAAYLGGEPGAAAALATDANDILGFTALLTLAATLAVGPVATLTGWRWHLILGRDLGLWTFCLAMLDLLIAVITSPTGWLDGIAGTAFVAAGAAATLVMVPLAITSNRLSMHVLGRYWKVLHKVVWVVAGLVVLHLVLLVGLRALGPLAVLFGPSIVLRVPPVRQAIVKWRKARSATS